MGIFATGPTLDPAISEAIRAQQLRRYIKDKGR